MRKFLAVLATVLVGLVPNISRADSPLGGAKATPTEFLSIGGVTGSGTDNRVTRWDGTSAVQDSNLEISDASALSGVFELFFDSDSGSVIANVFRLQSLIDGQLILKNAAATNTTTLTLATDELQVDDSVNISVPVNDGNPYLFIGSSSSNQLEVIAQYTGGAQTLDVVDFITRESVNTPNKGAFQFWPDEILKFTIDDNGAELPAGDSLTWTARTVLSSTGDGEFQIADNAGANLTKFTTAPSGLVIADDTTVTGAATVNMSSATDIAVDVTASAITTGQAARFYSDSADATARSVVEIINDNVAATGAIGLRVQQDAPSPALAIDAQGDVSITGKLTVTGLIDPTGLVLDEQASVPGGNPAAGKSTFWIDSTSGEGKITDENGVTQVLASTAGSADIIITDPTNDGNPFFAAGSSATERFELQAIYDSGAQTFDAFQIRTKAASVAADKGRIEFYPDETLRFTVDDSGAEFPNSSSLTWTSGAVLSSPSSESIRLAGNAGQSTDITSDASGLTITDTTTVAGDFIVSDTTPFVRLTDSNGALDTKHVELRNNDQVLTYVIVNDALGDERTPLRIIENGDILSEVSRVGANHMLQVTNTSGDDASGADVAVIAGPFGDDGGDAIYYMSASSLGNTWAFGLDNSDAGDPLEWNFGFVLDNTPEMQLTSAGDLLVRGDLDVQGGDISTGASVNSTLFNTTTNGTVDIASGLTSGNMTVGTATGTSTLLVGGGAGSGLVTIGSTTRNVSIPGTLSMGSPFTVSAAAPAFRLTDTSTGPTEADFQLLLDADVLTFGIDADSNGTYEITAATVAAATGRWTINPGITVDNTTLDADTLSTSSGNLTLDPTTGITAQVGNASEILRLEGTASAQVQLRDTGATSGQQAVALTSDAQQLKIQQLSDAYAAPTDRVTVDLADGDIVTTGDVAVNGGDITSTGALTISANAGAANVSIDGSSNGDFIVDTTTLYVDSGNNQVGIGVAPSLFDLEVSASESGGSRDFGVLNTSNTANSHARINVQQGGASGGDAYATWVVSGAGGWANGLRAGDITIMEWNFVASTPALDTTPNMSLTSGSILTLDSSAPALRLSDNSIVLGTDDAELSMDSDLFSLKFDGNDDGVYEATAMTIDSTSGNTVISGTLAVNGDSITSDGTNFDIHNESSGTDTLTLGGGAGTGTVTVGSATRNVSIPGTLTVTGGSSNTQVLFNSSGVVSGDAGMTYNSGTDSLTLAGDIAVNGGNITSTAAQAFDLQSAVSQDITLSTNGGTIAATFDSSQNTTLAGNLTLPATGNITYTGRSVVTSDATNGLTVSNDVNVQGGDIRNTSGALTVTPLAGTNLNVTLSTTGDFAVNTNHLYVDTSTERVGIGTTIPEKPLHVTYTEASGTSIGQIVNNRNSTTGFSSGIGFGVTSNIGVLGAKITHIRTGSNSNGDLVFYTKSDGSASSDTTTEKMRILSTGEVGINDTAPDAMLDVNGSTANGTTLTLQLGDSADVAVGTVDTDGNATFAGGLKVGNTTEETTAGAITSTGLITSGGNVNVQGGTVTNSTGALALTSASNGNISLTPNGTGVVPITSGTATGVAATITANSLTTGGGLLVQSSSTSTGGFPLVDIQRTGNTASGDGFAMRINTETDSTSLNAAALGLFGGTSDGSSYIWSAGNDAVALLSTLDTSGNVTFGGGLSVGTTTETTSGSGLFTASNNGGHTLTVENTNTGAAATSAVIVNTSSTLGGDSYIRWGVDTGAWSAGPDSGSADILRFSYSTTATSSHPSSGNEKMSLSTTGDLTTTGTITASQSTNVYSGDFKNTGNTTTNYGINIDAGTFTIGNDTRYVNMRTGDGSAEAGYITRAAGVMTLVTVSDARLKKNIAPQKSDATDLLDEIGVYEFDWREGGTHTSWGFVAQDVQSALPGAVTVGDKGMLGVSFAHFVPVLVKAVQEIASDIASLWDSIFEHDDRIAELEARLLDLEAKVEDCHAH